MIDRSAIYGHRSILRGGAATLASVARMPQLVIDRRFNGPPDSGNGGYSCGTLARFIDGAAQVTLRRPPPLGRSLEVRHDEGRVALFADEEMIAEAVAAEVDIELPDPVGIEEARAAAAAYPGFNGHPFPTCFVCGPERSERDGLGIFPGPIPERRLVAAPWTPPPSLADDAGVLPPEVVWASLDCPGGWSFIVSEHGHESVTVLGRQTAKLLAPVHADQRYVAVGWPLDKQGRKHFTGTAVFSDDGDVVAFSKQTWIELR